MQQQYRASLAEINDAARVGAISERERASALQTTKDAFAKQVVALKGASAANAGVAASGSLARHEMINLSRQFQDVGVSLASGQSPFLVAIQQGTQIADVFASSEGSVKGFFKQAVAGAASFLSPAVLVTGAVLAIGAAGAIAASQWGAAQQQINLALTGAGRATGVMASDINRIAGETASPFGLSISEARAFATELAATGKIGKDNIAPIVALGHDVAIAFGTDAAGAAKLLAKSFADPAKGAVELNAKLGFLDAATLRQITNLQTQNQLFAAQASLQAGVARGVEGVNQTLSTSSKFWTAIGVTISDAWDAFGRGAARVTGVGFTKGLDEKLGEATAKVDNLKKRLADLEGGDVAFLGSAGRGVVGRLTKQLQEAQVELDKLTGDWKKYWDAAGGAAERQNSFATSAAVDAVSPEIRQLAALRNQSSLLNNRLKEVNDTGGAASPKLLVLGQSYDEVARAAARAAADVAGFKSAQDKAIAGLDLQIEAVGKRAPAQLGSIAYKQQLLNLGRSADTKDPEAIAQAQKASTLATAQAQQQITDAKAQQLLSARQATELSKLELGISGQSSVQQERQRSLL